MLKMPEEKKTCQSCGKDKGIKTYGFQSGDNVILYDFCSKCAAAEGVSKKDLYRPFGDR